MTRIILNEILRVVILNLLYTSMYSDGSRLYPEFNPLVKRPFKLVCDTETTITSTVTIRLPNGITAGYCNPASNLVLADCTSSSGYSSALNETENTVTISTSSLASNVSGTWTCTYIDDQASYNLTDPIREIEVETFTLFPTSFTDNITSKNAPISLSATYGCINLPVFFKWFVVDSTFNKIDISGTNNAAENSSVCTSLSGFNGYTETKVVNEEVYSSNYVKNLNGSYRLGVEVHYTDEVTTLHSIKYFDTYFVFSSGGTTTSTDNDGTAIGILFGWLVIAYIIVIVMVALRLSIGSTGKTSGNCFLTFCQFIKEKFFDCCGSESSQESEGEGEGEGDPDIFKDKVLTLKSLIAIVYLVLYGVIVEVFVLVAVYYGSSKFQEGLVIGVGFVIVLALSCLCLVVVWILMKFVNNGASENSSSLSCRRNGTVTPHETGPQSTPKDPDASKKPKDKKKKKKKKKKKDEEQDNPADLQDNNALT